MLWLSLLAAATCASLNAQARITRVKIQSTKRFPAFSLPARDQTLAKRRGHIFPSARYAKTISDFSSSSMQEDVVFLSRNGNILLKYIVRLYTL